MSSSFNVPQLEHQRGVDEGVTEVVKEATGDKTTTEPSGNESSRKVFQYQMAVTLTLVFTWITTGLRASVDGATLADRRDRLGVETSDMSRIIASMSAVGMFSGIFFAVFADMWKRYAILFMSIALGLCAVIMVVMHLITDYVAYFTLSMCIGLLFPPVDLIGNAVILRTWGERAAGPMYAIHFGYGIGASIGPFIAKPFLSPDIAAPGNYTNTSTESPVDMTTTDDEARFPDGSRLEVPYMIIGSFTLAVAVALFVLFIIGPPDELKISSVQSTTTSDERQSLKEVCNPHACANNSLPCAILFLITIFFFYVWITAREIGLNVYLVIYATESDLGFSKDAATTLMGVKNIFYSLGRLCSIVLSRWLSIHVLFRSEVIIVTVLHVGLAILGRSEQVAYASFSCAIAFFGSPLWPGEMAWADQYITLTSTSLFLMPLGSSIGSVVVNPFYGTMLDEGRYDAYMLLLLLSALLLFVTCVVAIAAGIQQGTRFATVEHEHEEDTHVYVIGYSKNDDNCEVNHAFA